MAHKTCACPTCFNTSMNKNVANLLWFPFPKSGFIRDQWIDVLGVKDCDVTDNCRVCSIHFKPKEILKGHKQLKSGTVPSLHLGKKGESYTLHGDSDIELSDDEVKLVEETKKPEPFPDVNVTPEGRPSRRAARMAAEKIQKTVQKYCMDEDNSPPRKQEFDYDPVMETKPALASVVKSPHALFGSALLKKCAQQIAPKPVPTTNQIVNLPIRKNTPIAPFPIKLASPMNQLTTPTNKKNAMPLNQQISITQKNQKPGVPINPKIIVPGKNQIITYPGKSPVTATLVKPQTTTTVILKPMVAPQKNPQPQLAMAPKQILPRPNLHDVMNLQMECLDSPLSNAQLRNHHIQVKAYEEFEKKMQGYKNAKDTRIIYCNHNEIPPINNSPITTSVPSLPQGSSTIRAAEKTTITNSMKGSLLQPGMVLTSTPQGMQFIRGVVPSQTIGNTVNNMSGNKTLSYKVLVDSRTGLVVGTIPNDSSLLKTNTVGSNNQVQTVSLPTAATKSVQSTPNSGLTISSVQGSSVTSGDFINKILTGGNKTVVAQSLLSIKVVYQDESTKKQRNIQITQLGQQLDKQKYLSAPILWLARIGLIDREIKCLCMRDKMELSACKLSVDGYLWRCKRHPKCQRTVQIPRVNFFARFGAQLYKLHRLIFHWSIQSDILHVIHDTVVDIYMVRTVWRAIQEVCGKTMDTKAFKLGGMSSKVEVATMKLGWHVIIGVYDRGTGSSRMKVVTDAKSQPFGLSQVIHKALDKWLNPHTTVITTDYKLTTLSRNQITYKYVDPTKTYSNEMTVKNVIEHMETQLTRMFGSFSMSQLKPETIQGFLDEYQWRVRFGNTPKMAFWNIMSDIASQNGRKLIVPSDAMMTESISSSSSEDDSDEKQKSQITSFPHQGNTYGQPKKVVLNVQGTSPKFALASPEPPKLVDLNNYYYARKSPDAAFLLPDSNLNNYKFKCLVCRKILDNNIKVMKHIMAHLEQTRQRNPDLSDVTQCKYCFRDFETPYSMQCHIENVHLNTNDLACKICNHALANKSSLVNHMKHHHVQSEIPYGCQACNYRSSFHSEVIEHFQQTHNGTNKLLCHYCLKAYSVKFSQPSSVGMIQNYYYHLYKHQIKSANKKCSNCCLVFVNVMELKNHRQKDHVSWAKKKDVVPLPINTTKPILVPEPTKKPPKPTNKSPTAANKKQVSKSGPPVLEPYSSNSIPRVYSEYQQNTKNPVLVSEIEGTHTCLECNQMIERTHYVKKMICGKCRYSTYCGKAFVDHMIAQHSNVTKNKKDMYFVAESLKLDSPMFCICGFKSQDCNILANHLKKCGYTTCFPSIVAANAATVKREPEDIPCDKGSAFFPPLVVLDDNEEEFVNNTLSKIPEPAVEQSSPSKKRKRIEFEKTVSEAEKPSMLNALGLVRRRSTQSDEEDDDDCPPLLSREDGAPLPKKCPARNTRSSRTAMRARSEDIKQDEELQIPPELEVQDDSKN